MLMILVSMIILEKGFIAELTMGAGQESGKISVAQFNFIASVIGDGPKFQVYIVQLIEHLGRAIGDFPAHGQNLFLHFTAGMGFESQNFFQIKSQSI